MLSACQRPISWKQKLAPSGLLSHSCRIVAALYNKAFDLASCSCHSFSSSPPIPPSQPSRHTERPLPAPLHAHERPESLFPRNLIEYGIATGVSGSSLVFRQYLSAGCCVSHHEQLIFQHLCTFLSWHQCKACLRVTAWTDTLLMERAD